nr:hypothetical protein CFP56_57174 [Quercus suber]
MNAKTHNGGNNVLSREQVQFIEKEEDEALKKIEDISATIVERKKKPENAKIAVGLNAPFYVYCTWVR